MADLLTIQQVQHVAKLARLRLSDSQVQEYRVQLSSVLEHIAKLNELDTSNVEPLAHPTGEHTRLDADEVGPTLPIEALAINAPAIKDRYIAVPKVLGEGGGA
jgi:aspartyl-tRNA(Asn)/glutamyl-tRNA(Gln) amidotransferase subunit C